MIKQSEHNYGKSSGVESEIDQVKHLQEELNQARQTIEDLSEELAETNNGMMALSLELEDRVDKRTFELLEANARLKQEITINQSMLRLGHAMVAITDIAELADIFLDEAKKLTKSGHGYVAVVDPDNKDLICYTLTKMMGDNCSIKGENQLIRFPCGKNGKHPLLLGHCLNTRQAFFTNSLQSHNAFTGQTPEGHVSLEAFLSAPAIRGQDVVGQIALANPSEKYTDHHLHVIKSLAEQWSIAIARYRAEKSLLKEKEQAQQYLDIAGTVILAINADEEVTLINQAGCKLLGYPEDEITGKNWFDHFIPSDSRNIIRGKFQSLMSGYPHSSQTFENLVLTKSGETKLVAWHNYVLSNDQGQTIGTLSSGEDISLQNQAEEELINSKNLLAIALEKSNRKQSEVSALLEASRAVLANQNFAKAARKVFDIAKELIGADSGYVALLGEDGDENELLFLEAGGRPCTVDPELPMPVRGLRAEAYKSGQVALDNDFVNSRWLKFMPAGHVELDNVVFAPLNIAGKTLGIIGLANKPGGFDQDDTRLIEAFGEISAMALRNSQLLETLEKSEAETRTLFATMSEGFCLHELVYNPQGMACDYRLLDVNLKFEEITGIAREDAVGALASDIYGTGEAPYLETYQQVAEEHQTVFFETYFEPLEKHFSISAFSPQKGRFATVFSDVTERWEYETRIQESEERFNFAMNATQDGLFDWDLITNAIYYSPGWKKMLGYEYDELPNDFSIWEKLTHPEDVKKSWKMQQELTSKKRDRFELEFKMKHKDGNWIDILSRATAVFDVDGEAIRIIGTHVDISERKKLEKKLADYSKNLEVMVTQRTQELEMANKELESFAYSVSHDLRAPLRSLDGFSQALLEDYQTKLDEEGQDYLNRIRRASQNMGQLIDDLLKLSRIIRTEIEKQAVDLTSLAQDIVQRIQEQDPHREVELMVQSDLLYECDQNLVQVLLINLLGNAWKFTAKQPAAKIEFGVTNQFSDLDSKVFFIRDNGIGFDTHYKNKLFLAFQRLHSNKDYPGTGIGLATAKRIIDRHGGRIWAESTEGNGSTFYFTLGEQ